MALRRILHLDMDAFYASVEQRDDPSLRGKPVAVGGRVGERGVVAAASYEARAFGVRSAMSMSAALRNCPQLVVVRPDMSKYHARVEDGVRAVPRRDAAGRAAVDGRGVPRRHRERLERAARRERRAAAQAAGARGDAAHDLGRRRARTSSSPRSPRAGRSRTGSPSSRPERMEDFLQKLPVDALWGVGPKTAARLRAAGIERLVDVRAPGRSRAHARWSAAWPAGCAASANGVDERRVEPHRETKSSGSERTYTEDLTRPRHDPVARSPRWPRARRAGSRSATRWRGP